MVCREAKTGSKHDTVASQRQFSGFLEMSQNSLDMAVTPQSRTSSSPLSMKSFGAMFLLALMWGLSIPITKLGLGSIPPMTLTALRFMVAGPLMMFLARRELRVPAKAVLPIIGLGVMGITLGNVAQSFGVQGTSASVATILSATIPLFIVILAAVRFRQAVTPLQWSGLLAAFFGIALVAVGSGPGVDDRSRTTVSGVVLMLISAVGIAINYIWSAELTETYGLMPVAAWNMLVGRKGQSLDQSLIRKPYLKVAHFSVEKPAQFCAETNSARGLDLCAVSFSERVSSSRYRRARGGSAGAVMCFSCPWRPPSPCYGPWH